MNEAEGFVRAEPRGGAMKTLAGLLVKHPEPIVDIEETCERCGSVLEILDGELVYHRCCVCQDARYVRLPRPADDPLFGKVELCYACAARSPATGEAARQLMERVEMHVPALYASATLANWKDDGDPHALEAALAYIDRWPPKKPILTLYSKVKGNGKTHLAIGILKALHTSHKARCGFYPVPELLDRYRAASSPDSREGPDEIDAEIGRLDAVVLDDMGVGRQNAFTAERIYKLVNQRYSALRPLIITTNETRGIEERVRSRAFDTRVGTVCELMGRDRRPEQ